MSFQSTVSTTPSLEFDSFGGGKLVIASNRLPITIKPVKPHIETKKPSKPSRSASTTVATEITSNDSEPNDQHSQVVPNTADADIASAHASVAKNATAFGLGIQPSDEGGPGEENEPEETNNEPEHGEYEYSKSSGGLVSGLAGLLKDKDYLWYGWPGLEVPENDMTIVEARLKDEHLAVPVWFSNELADQHYNGFSNEILWALLHYHPGEFTFNEIAWQAYRTVNQLFAQRMIKDLHDGDVVWCHDYHLMLLPMFLRQEADKVGITLKIGWFLHTPWPSSEVYRILPVRSEILEGLLHADLLGFHTYDYLRHFTSSCNRLLVASTSPSALKYSGHVTGLGVFPIGIDPIKFAESFNTDKVQQRIRYYRDEFRDAKIIVGCDRLDYIKAIPHKLHAFQHMLDQHPELIGKVKLVQIAIPTRGDVEEYQELKRMVDELVGHINSSYGNIEFMPINLKHTSVGHEDLTALFAASDACLITSTRDGMNLVAYEYVACQEERKGTLILSEFTGCAQSFAAGAILVQPWDIVNVSEGMYKAVTMSQEEREQRHGELWNYVNKYTSSWWGETFLGELLRVTDESDEEEEEADSNPEEEVEEEEEEVEEETLSLVRTESNGEGQRQRRSRRSSAASRHKSILKQYITPTGQQMSISSEIDDLLRRFGHKLGDEHQGRKMLRELSQDPRNMVEAFPDCYTSLQEYAEEIVAELAAGEDEVESEEEKQGAGRGSTPEAE